MAIFKWKNIIHLEYFRCQIKGIRKLRGPVQWLPLLILMLLMCLLHILNN